MLEYEKEIYKIIHESADPEAVAAYALNLCLDYLRKNGSCQQLPACDQQESA